MRFILLGLCASMVLLSSAAFADYNLDQPQQSNDQFHGAPQNSTMQQQKPGPRPLKMPASAPQQKLPGDLQSMGQGDNRPFNINNPQMQDPQSQNGNQQRPQRQQQQNNGNQQQ